MFGSFQSKTPSLNNRRQNILIAILILLDFFTIIFCASLFILFRQKPVSPPVSGGKILQSEEMPDNLKAGEIGEISEKEAKEKGILPISQIIVNTRGNILGVQADRLIVEGDGSSFADRQPRTIVIVFTDSTITNDPAKKTFYTGLEGLKHLTTGMRISIEGAENIKGRTEFNVGIISINY